MVFGPPAGRPTGWLPRWLPAGRLAGCLPRCPVWWVGGCRLASASWLALFVAGQTDHHRDKGAQPTRPRTAGEIGRSQAKTDHQRENSCRNLFRRIWAPGARSTQGDPFRRIWVAQRPQGATLNNNNAADVRFEGFWPLGSGNGAQTQKKKVHSSQTKQQHPIKRTPVTAPKDFQRKLIVVF